MQKEMKKFQRFLWKKQFIQTQLDFAFLRTCVCSFVILLETYVLHFLIFAFSMQIWFFSRLLSIHKCENEQILEFQKSCFPGPNLTCDLINENGFLRQIDWQRHRVNPMNTLEIAEV